MGRGVVAAIAARVEAAGVRQPALNYVDEPVGHVKSEGTADERIDCGPQPVDVPVGFSERA